MNIISSKEIENLFVNLHPTLDLSTIITIDDEDLSKILHYYLFLKQYPLDIAANSSFTYEMVLYSQYYWFLYFKHHYFLKFGYDGDMDDQESRLIENLTNNLAGEVDWELLEKIHNQMKQITNTIYPPDVG